jgi:hypothetical protein
LLAVAWEMPSSRAAPEKLRVLATLEKTAMLVSRSKITTQQRVLPAIHLPLFDCCDS